MKGSLSEIFGLDDSSTTVMYLGERLNSCMRNFERGVERASNSLIFLGSDKKFSTS